MTDSAHDSWSLLRSGIGVGSGLGIPTIPMGVSAGAGPVRLAIGPNDEPRVLLPLLEGELPTGIDAGNALSVSVSSFHHGGRILRFLDLVCLSTDLETVFGEVVDEILGRITHGDGSIDAARSTIEDFRTLLTHADSGDVDAGRVSGLVAELLVLNRLLDHSASAWRAWSGPAGDRHDFRSGDHSLEVKATHRLSASAITINGLDQLDAPVGGTLHLLRIVLESVSGGALNISGLGRSALSKADKPDRVRGLLTAVGCRDVDSESWNRTSFRIASETLYEIRPGFPRLISSMLAQGTAPHGVHEVSYRIDLSVAETFRCDAAAYRLLESRLCQ